MTMGKHTTMRNTSSKTKTDKKLHPLDARYVDVAELTWEPTSFEGIHTKVLYADAKTGMSTILFKMDPGAVVPQHEHTALEQTYLLEGSLVDEQGAVTAGNYVWRPAGNSHRAWAPDGAVFLSFFMKPNKFLSGAKFFTEQESGADETRSKGD